MSTYSYSFNQEQFYGAAPSPEGAAQEAFAECPDAQFVFVAENKLCSAHDFIDVPGILEDIACAADDIVGEAAEDWLQTLKQDKEKCAELEKLIADWIKENDPVLFSAIENERKITRKELEEVK